MWIEKILEPGEQLRDWPVEGTTGYEFANDSTALFVDPAGEQPLTELYAELTGERRSVRGDRARGEARDRPHDVRAGVRRLRTLFPHDGLEEAAASLHVYRTYVEPATGRVEDEDRARFAPLPDDLRRVVLLEGERSPPLDEFVIRWQQTTGPVMAKGVEDTAFYRYFRLVALNEVGGDPGRFSIAPDEFHAARRSGTSASRCSCSHRRRTTRNAPATCAPASARSPACTSEWAARVHRWRELTGGMDDPNEEYLVWQTLVGAWPIVPSRLEQYLMKALRESKRNTNWLDPDERHEARVRSFIRSLYENQAFLDDFEPFVHR